MGKPPLGTTIYTSCHRHRQDNPYVPQPFPAWLFLFLGRSSLYAAGPQHGKPTRGLQMERIEGAVAFITGGASGMGLGMAQVFSRAGMRVVIADIRQAAVDVALP